MDIFLTYTQPTVNLVAGRSPLVLDDHGVAGRLEESRQVADDQTMSTPTEPVRRRLAAATRQVAPFLIAAIAAPLVSIGEQVSVHESALLSGFVLLALSAISLICALAWSLSEWVHRGCVFAMLGALALLVYGAGGTSSGATLVLLVPVVWMALYGTRLDVLVTLALMLTAIVGLTLAEGLSEVTTSDVRRIVVFLTVPALTAWTVSSLVQRLGASERDARTGQQTLAAVTEAAKTIAAAGDPRDVGCTAMLSVARS